MKTLKPSNYKLHVVGDKVKFYTYRVKGETDTGEIVGCSGYEGNMIWAIKPDNMNIGRIYRANKELINQ